MKHPGGRPSIYSKELADKICERIAKGESVRNICKDTEMPDAGTIFNWLLDSTKIEFLKQYTRARDIQSELMFEEIIEIADEAEDAIVGDDKSDSARVQARKLRIDARHWHLSKLRPKKYGDKLDLTSGGEKMPQPIINVLPNNSTTENNKSE
jgi:hypothetical protein